MNLCNEWEDRTGKCLARDHGALTEWNATGSMINRILEGQTDNGFSTWCNLKNSYLIYLGSTSYQLRWFTSEDMLINLFRRYIFDKKGRLSVIRIWTFPNFYYLTDLKKLSVLFVYLDLFPYHCTAWVIRRMPIHCDPANGNYKLLPCLTLFLRETMPSKTVFPYSLTVPLKVSCFWRRFHLILSCRCHSGACVIYQINWLIVLRYPWSLSLRVGESPRLLLMSCRFGKNLHYFHKWLFACTNFILNTHQITLQNTKEKVWFVITFGL